MACNMTAINITMSDWTAGDDGKVRGFDPSGTTPLDVRAFPGAEGRAALTRGAAGYTGAKSVAFVDNLNDSGAGSLRAAVEGVGKEGTFVIFRTSGTINLLTRLDVLSDYITIAGQTSPSGICITGNAVQVGNSDTTNISDVVIRHTRFRSGYKPQVEGGTVAPADAESFRLWKCSNVIVDHCSISWAGDENSSVTTYNDASVYDITFSKSLFSQGLTSAVFPDTSEGNHGYGLLFNGTYHNSPENGIDVHHCLFAHFNDRTPQISGAGRVNIVNNLIYNPYASQGAKVVPYGTAVGQDALFVNFKNNYIIPGASTNDSIANAGNASEIQLSSDADGVTPWGMLYMVGNYGVNRLLDGDGEWQLSDSYRGYLASTDWQSLTEFTISGGKPVTETSLTAATLSAFRDSILADVGATKPVIDSHDTQMINDVNSVSGDLLAELNYTDDSASWPVFGSDASPTDTDSDGIPDAYWTYRSVAVQNWDDTAPDGYLWIENYINDVADGRFA